MLGASPADIQAPAIDQTVDQLVEELGQGLDEGLELSVDDAEQFVSQLSEAEAALICQRLERRSSHSSEGGLSPECGLPLAPEESNGSRQRTEAALSSAAKVDPTSRPRPAYAVSPSSVFASSFAEVQIAIVPPPSA